MSKKHKHTSTIPGKRVVIALQDGTIIEDRFVCRAKNRRWIQVAKHGRIAIADIKSFSDLKGPLDLKRLAIAARVP